MKRFYTNNCYNCREGVNRETGSEDRATRLAGLCEVINVISEFRDLNYVVSIILLPFLDVLELYSAISRRNRFETFEVVGMVSLLKLSASSFERACNVFEHQQRTFFKCFQSLSNVFGSLDASLVAKENKVPS